MGGKFRGQRKWDPALIVGQIITVQLLSYASLTIMISITAEMSGYGPSVVFIFDHRIMRLSTTKLVIIAHLANSLVGAYLLRVFVERSKSCLDFSLTYYIIHFICVWYYNKSMPDTFIWYFINACGAFIMCVASEFLCRKEEMKSIPISASVWSRACGFSKSTVIHSFIHDIFICNARRGRQVLMW